MARMDDAEADRVGGLSLGEMTEAEFEGLIAREGWTACAALARALRAVRREAREGDARGAPWGQVVAELDAYTVWGVLAAYLDGRLAAVEREEALERLGAEGAPPRATMH